MNYSRIIGEAPMRMMNPFVMVSRLDMWFLELATVGSDFRRLPSGFWNIGVFIEQRGGPGAPEVGTTHQGAAGPPSAPWWVVLPSEHPQGASSTHWMSSSPKKISKKFRCVWTPFGIDLMRCKKTCRKQQLALGTMSIG